MTSKAKAVGQRPSVAAVVLAIATAGSLVGPAVAVENAAAAQEAIAIEGNRRIDSETIRSYFHPNAQGRYDEAARDAALKALIATGRSTTSGSSARKTGCVCT